MPLLRILNVANMSFFAIRGNIILAIISEFTVYGSLSFIVIEAIKSGCVSAKIVLSI